MGDPQQVILLGADSPIGLTVVRELGEHGVRVHGIAWSERGLGLHSNRLASGHIRARGDGELVDQLNGLARRSGCRWLMTVGESDMLWLYRHRHRLPALTPLLPGQDSFDQVLHKDRTYAVAQQLGIRTPRTWRIDRAEQARGLPLPLIAKWSNPHAVAGRLGAIGRSPEKLRYFHEHEALVGELLALDELGVYPLLQEYVPGYGLGQMLFMHQGRAALVFQHRRLAEWPPEGGVSAVCESLPPDAHANLLARSVELLRAIGWSGPAMVEYRYDERSAQACLMEINGRFWGSQPLAYHAGAHFAWLSFATAALGSPPDPPSYEVGLRCRFFVPEVKRLLRILLHPERIQDRRLRVDRLAELGRFLGWYFSPRTRYYVFRLADPKPFLADVRFMLRKLVRGDRAG